MAFHALYPVLPESQAYFQRLRLWNLFFARLPCLYKRCFTPFKSGFAWSHTIRSKGTGLQSPAPPLLKSPPALCRANSSHRLRRMLRSPEWCPPASDVLMFLATIHFILKIIRILTESPLPGWTIFIGFASMCFVLGEGEPEAG